MKNAVIKKPVIIIIIGILTAGIIITGVCFMLFKNQGQDGIGSSVEDIEGLTLRLSGMRITEEYELTANGDEAELSYYTIAFKDGEEKRVLKKKTVCDTKAVIDALNRFGFAEWNGFSGKHPKGVLDGTMFSLTATLNGGQRLTASGSQNFPEHFHEFERWLYDMLKDCEEIEA